MIKNKIISVVLTLSALAILVFLYVKTTSVDNVAFESNMGALHELQRIDSTWTSEALKTRAALNKNFDDIAAILPKLREIRQQLKSSELNNSSIEFEDANLNLKKLLKLLDTKERHIERFKSSHAVMRNSVRYLPTGATELQSALLNSKTKELAATLDVFLNKIYAYLLLPDNETKQELLLQLSEFKAKQSTLSEDIVVPYSRFLNHSRVILQRYSETKNILEKAIATPTNTGIKSLIDSYNDVQNIRLESIELYRLGLVAYSAFLLLVVLLFSIKLAKSYRELNKSNAKLFLANSSLEIKVEDRTKELQESQSHLVQSEKMAAIGQMVAGVAHEINTPLGYVSSNVELVKDMLSNFNILINSLNIFSTVMKDPATTDEEFSKHITQITDQANNIQESDLLNESTGLLDDAKYGLSQISEIVINLKDFSRMDRAQTEQFDINTGLQSTMKIANNILKYVGDVQTEFGEVPQIKCSPSQINQVFLNVITNAAHAVTDIDRKGIIKVKTHADENNVYISIQDNGIGMDEDVQAHIFEAFYTTKDVGEGTGLGMSISHKIIGDHQGEIKLISKLNVGTNFMIVLPIKAASTNTAEQAA